MLTPRTWPATAVVCLCLAAGAAAVAWPARSMVDGLSMAPGLLPGDVVSTGAFPAVTRPGGPRRFDRWILTPPGGGAVIKRVVGLPGETVSIRDGDLAVDGEVVVAPPRVLAQTATLVSGTAAGGDPRPHGPGGCRRGFAADLVLDDAAFAPTERRLLLPVRDVGLAATVRIPAGRSGPRLRARVGPFVVAWRLPTAGCYAVVSGRLDGRLVAVCWRPAGSSVRREPRSCLPADVPDAWSSTHPWPAAAADDQAPPTLGLWIGAAAASPADEPADGCDPSAGAITSFVVWRDVLHRPAADGRDTWRLGPDEHFVLGDFPSGSRDSRHWGPVRRDGFRAAVHAVR